MGCYCFNSDKKILNSEQILNVQLYENEQNKTPITNIEIINKNIINDNCSNNTHKNNYNNNNHINNTNIIISNNILNKRFSDKKLIRNHESTKNSIFSFD